LLSCAQAARAQLENAAVEREGLVESPTQARRGTDGD
jgi:hypothetical protein